MSSDARDAYLESKILTADPVELVRILYHAAIERVRAARAHLANGDICARSNAISRAVKILGELNVSLRNDAERGVSRQLAELYDYMQRRLVEANYRQIEEPLGEVLALLMTLAQVWDEVKTRLESQVSTAQPDNPLFQELPLETGQYSSQNWTG